MPKRFRAVNSWSVSYIKQLIVVGAPYIKDHTREHSYRFVEALVNIACPGYRFRTILQEISITICQFFYSLDVDLDLEPPKIISTILDTHAACDEYLEISGFLQDRDEHIKGGPIEMIFLIIRSGKQDTLPGYEGSVRSRDKFPASFRGRFRSGGMSDTYSTGCHVST